MGESGRCSCGVALESRDGKAYNEEAFRYFLAIERKRAKASRSSILLVLVRTQQPSGPDRRLSPIVASAIFEAMWRCFREIDVAGWFRQDRIAGAVLTIGADPLSADVVSVIDRRFTEALRQRVLADAGVPPAGAGAAAFSSRRTLSVCQRQLYCAASPPRRRAPTANPPDLHVLSPELFREVLIRERNRAVRLDHPCALRLIALDGAVGKGAAAESVRGAANVWSSVIEAFSRAVGDTAFVGWLEPQVSAWRDRSGVDRT